MLALPSEAHRAPKAATEVMRPTREERVMSEARDDRTSEDAFSVTFLGTGSAMPDSRRTQTGLLLERDGNSSDEGDGDGRDRTGGPNVLVDCGSGVLGRLARTEPGYEGIATVLLTHHHLDHVSDLMPLIKARWLADVEELAIVGPEGTMALLDGLFGVYEYMQDRIDLTIREVGPGEFSVPGFDVAAMETRHSMYCLAYRFTPAGASSESSDGESGTGVTADDAATDGRSDENADAGNEPDSSDDASTFTYSADSEAFPELCAFANSGTLAHDCSFPDEVDVSNHPTPAQLGSALSEADADLDRVYLTHLYPHTQGRHEAMLASIGERYDGDVRFARDELRVAID